MYFIEAGHYDIQTTKRSLLLPPARALIYCFGGCVQTR